MNEWKLGNRFHKQREIKAVSKITLFRLKNQKFFFEIIRQYAAKSAKEIVASIIDSLNHFRQDVIPEDDMTLVVVKIVA